ncbi:UNVERIFIED_CONTAM: Peroxidase 19 [Sesamum latifolium]|uniref:Peroxidase n=1 Tax=Sesamum latifolium TaxID=2727402 RepID=A0AAW2WPL2_9LAMI
MSFSSTPFPALFLLLLLSNSIANAANSSNRRPRYQLSLDYYAKSCPQVDQLVASITSQQFKEAPISAPATIRLFFHDCFVEDAEGKELAVEAFDTVNKAKAVVESKCPGVVSCADILAIAARDFVHLAGGPYYQVKKGRWDGKLSMASRVPSNLPRANATVDELLRLFNSKGLTLEDLVILSGAHTIGFAHCRHFVSRLYDYKGTRQPDPSIDPRLLKALKMSCPHYGGNTDIVAPFDVTTPFSFDNAYYGNLEAKMGCWPLIRHCSWILEPGLWCRHWLRTSRSSFKHLRRLWIKWDLLG